MSQAQDEDYKLLETRLKTLLPEEYQESYEAVQPVSMGSAGLKFAPDGRVAWDEIWGSFCDLAMAGGPPHRGTLLEPATKAEIAQNPGRYQQVTDELCRGIGLVTGLAAEPSRHPGWLHIDCPSTGMAGWLLRAISMENISAHAQGMVLYLPAGPAFRLEKEIKNVITSIAKTCHYWLGHTSVAQHRAIATLFDTIQTESPLLHPPFPDLLSLPNTQEALCNSIAAEILAATGLLPANSDPGWLSLRCPGVPSAVWMMRVLVVGNVLARREDVFLYIPVNPSLDPTGALAITGLTRACRLAQAQGVL